jgi:hypothetical protein
MKVHGACHCGQIRYEAEVDPEKVNLCNCADCQMLTGSAFRVSVPAPAASYRLLSGTPVASTADSDAPPFYSLRVGCLRERAALPPRRRIWCRSALDWAQDVSGVPGIAGQ